MKKNELLQRILESPLQQHRESVREYLNDLTHDPVVGYSHEELDQLYADAKQLAGHFSMVETADVLSVVAALWSERINRAEYNRLQKDPAPTYGRNNRKGIGVRNGRLSKGEHYES